MVIGKNAVTCQYPYVDNLPARVMLLIAVSRAPHLSNENIDYTWASTPSNQASVSAFYRLIDTGAAAAVSKLCLDRTTS